MHQCFQLFSSIMKAKMWVFLLKWKLRFSCCFSIPETGALRNTPNTVQLTKKPAEKWQYCSLPLQKGQQFCPQNLLRTGDSHETGPSGGRPYFTMLAPGCHVPHRGSLKMLLHWSRVPPLLIFLPLLRSSW